MSTYIKIVVALVIIVGAVFWAASSIRSQSYSGTDLNFAVGSGPVTINNTGDAPVTTQLTSAGTRTFTVTTSVEPPAGTSVKQGTGSTTTQLFEIVMPPGLSTFTVTRGTGVSAAVQSDAQLEATVQPLLPNDSRTTLIVAVVVILGALYYISRTTGHRWIHFLGIRTAKPAPLAPAVASASAGQGAELRAYGDNRADITPR